MAHSDHPWDKLEPASRMVRDPTRAIGISVAVSLKRIADALEKGQVMVGVGVGGVQRTFVARTPAEIVEMMRSMGADEVDPQRAPDHLNLDGTDLDPTT